MTGTPDLTPRLAFLVASEARRVLSDDQLAADPARLAQGWERRFVAEGHRVDEAVALYQTLGFETVADPIRQEELRDGCSDCEVVTLLRFKTIYTRPVRRSP